MSLSHSHYFDHKPELKFRVGSIVHDDVHGFVKIDEKVEDIKHGQPGYHGYIVLFGLSDWLPEAPIIEGNDKHYVWGYDSQVDFVERY